MSVGLQTKRGSALNRIGDTLARRLGVVFACLMLLPLLAAPAAFADGGREVRLRDKCDPASFNAVVGPGTCVGSGDVTFAAFAAKLNPADGGHHAWNFSRSTLDIKAGEAVRISNIGGEVHSFTEVVGFGTGIVPLLDAALPAGTGPAIPINPAGVPGSFVPAGQSFSISGLSTGTHLFQCLIHPWMRTKIRVG